MSDNQDIPGRRLGRGRRAGGRRTRGGGRAAGGVRPARRRREEARGKANLDLLLDVEIPISVEVGRTQMSLDEVLRLVPGSVIALDKKAEEPVDLRVNGKLVARGEVVLVDDATACASRRSSTPRAASRACAEARFATGIWNVASRLRGA
jgi:flagellar motor switch protein FliN